MEPIDVKIKIYLGYKYAYMYIQRNKSYPLLWFN